MEGLAVIWAPVRTLERVAGEQRVLLGFTITALSAVLGLVVAVVNALGGVTASQFTPRNFPDLPPAFYENAPEIVSVMLLISAVLSPFVWWVVVSLLMQLATRFFDGTGSLSAMLAVVGVANAPFVVFDALQVPAAVLQALLGPESAGASVVGVLTSLLSFFALAWHVVLVVIGAAFARRIGYGQSAGSCAISCAGCVGLILVVGVVFVVLIVVLVGAMGSTGAS